MPADPHDIALYLEIGARDGWCMVHCPDLPGLGYKAPSREAALALAPSRLAAEADWAARAEADWAARAGVLAALAGGCGGGLSPDDPAGGRAGRLPDRSAGGLRIAVAGEVTLDVPVATGDTEAIFEPERALADEAYVRYVLGYVRASRQALLALVMALPSAMLDWRPSEGKRSIGEILGHISDAEAYYLVHLGEPAATPGKPSSGQLWAEYAGRNLGLGPVERIERTRGFVLCRLSNLADDERRRVSVFPPHSEIWSARKVLRRLAWHERYHTRQIEAFLTL